MKVNTKKKAVETTMEERRLKISGMLRDKKSYRDMEKELGVSIATISKDVNILLAEWREIRSANVDDTVLSEIANLTWTIEEAKEQWEASKGRKITEIKYSADNIETDEAGKAKPRKGVTPDEIKIKTHYPERQYLETIIRAGERLSKLLGADAAPKATVDEKGDVVVETKTEINFISSELSKKDPKTREAIYQALEGTNGNGKR